MVDHVLGWFLLRNSLKALFLRCQLIWRATNKLDKIS